MHGASLCWHQQPRPCFIFLMSVKSETSRTAAFGIKMRFSLKTSRHSTHMTLGQRLCVSVVFDHASRENIALTLCTISYV